MRRSLLIVSLALLLLGASCGGGDPPEIDVGLPTKEMSAEDSAAVDKAAIDIMEGRLQYAKGEVAGLWVGIWDPEKGVYVRAYGKSDIDGDRDAEPDDFVRIASITKTFVATVVLQLAAENKLQLSDTVEEHLPELVERFPQLRGRTVRQLLSMRSGLPDFYDSWVEELAQEPTRTVPPERVIELALRDPVSAPGMSEYSNTNYILLGEIAESVTGTPLSTLIAERLTEPLGLSDTRLPPNDDTSLPEPAAHGYAAGCPDELEAMRVREGADLTTRSQSGALGAGGMVAPLLRPRSLGSVDPGQCPLAEDVGLPAASAPTAFRTVRPRNPRSPVPR